MNIGIVYQPKLISNTGIGWIVYNMLKALNDETKYNVFLIHQSSAFNLSSETIYGRNIFKDPTDYINISCLTLPVQSNNISGGEITKMLEDYNISIIITIGDVDKWYYVYPDGLSNIIRIHYYISENDEPVRYYPVNIKNNETVYIDEQKLFSKFNSVIHISEQSMIAFHKLFDNQTSLDEYIIEPPIHRWETNASKDDVYSFLKINPDQKYTLTVATNSYRKRLDNSILYFLKHIYDPDINNKYVLYTRDAGAFNLPALLYNLQASDKVIIIQPQDTFDIGALFTYADNYLSTSAGEGYGLPVFEANQLGIPLTITNTGYPFRRLSSSNYITYIDTNIPYVIPNTGIIMKTFDPNNVVYTFNHLQDINPVENISGFANKFIDVIDKYI